MAYRSQASSPRETLPVGALRLETNAFGALEGKCLVRIAKSLASAGPVLPVNLVKEEGPQSRYSLSIREDRIGIRATESGIFPALAALQELILSKNGSTCLPAGSYEAESRFGYRGVLVDDARHFQGVEAVKELLELMFRLQFNVLHWHLCDDQGFRIPLPGYPELRRAFRRESSHVGGYLRNQPDGEPYEGSYTPEEVREILRFAEERGIRVIPEIDMPGHHSAILYCYPQYACGEGGSMAPKEVPGRYGVLENTLCLGKPEARDFAKKLALDTARFLGSDTVHIGFDEIKTEQMRLCPDCRREAERRGLEDPAKLIPLFREEVRDYLRENGVRSMAWFDEAAFDGPDPEMTVIHWRPEGNKKAAEVTNLGQKAVMSDFYHYYLDYPYSMTPLKKTYDFEPILKGIRVPENVVGTECTLWSEYMSSPDKLRFNAYYRMAAVSRTAWSRDKVPYRDFLKELREKEEFWFGRKLAIPDRLLDPPLATRLRRLWNCLYRDADYEIKLWKQAE